MKRQLCFFQIDSQFEYQIILPWMGNQSIVQRRLVPSKLEYYSTIKHHHHKNVAIYTSKDMPLTFIMKIQRNIIRSRLFHFFQLISNENSPYLMILYGFKIQRNSNCHLCTNNEDSSDKTVQFWQYLNYSLYDHIQDRIRRRSPFTQHQIWHVLQVILQSLNILNQYGLNWQVNPHNLLITPQGKLKCQWSISQLNINSYQYQKILRQTQNLLEQNKQQSRCFIYQSNNANKDIERIKMEQFLSPEEEDRIFISKNKGQSIKINLQKCNVYKIGLLLVYMLSLQHPKYSNINQLIEKIKFQAQQKVFLKVFLKFLPLSLKENPQERCSMEQIQKQSHPFFSDQYELLINEGKRQDLQQYNVQAQLKMQKNTQNNQEKSYQRHRRFNLLQDNHNDKVATLQDTSKRQSKRQKFPVLNDKIYLLKQQPYTNLQKRMIELRQHRKQMLKNEYKQS